MMLLRTLCFSFCLLLLSATGAAQLVYKTPSGQKYHEAGCRMVKNSSEALTTAAAVKLGLEPCKICHVNAVLPLKTSSRGTPAGEASTVQCKGITKAGTRCKHRTKIGNGFRYQHQPE